MRSGARRVGVVAVLVAGAIIVGITPASGNVAISTTAIDFGPVALNTTAGPQAVTITNTSGASYGPLNIFGGAPPTPEFGASQNCQAQTLAAGGSCTINYTYTPTTPGPHSDSSAFTISPTASQSDGQDFTVTLVGNGGAPDPAATTTTTPAPDGEPPGAGDSAIPSGDQAPDGSGVAQGAFGELTATLEHPAVALGEEQTATLEGFQPGETIVAAVQPINFDLGTQIAGDDGVARFVWTVPEDNLIGEHEFVAIGDTSGFVSAAFAIVATPEEASSDSGTSPWLIALLVILALAVAGGVGVLAFRKGRSSGDRPPPSADATAPHPEV